MQSLFRDNPEARRYVSSQGIRELRAGGHIIQKIIAYGRGIFLAILSFRVSWTLHLRYVWNACGIVLPKQKELDSVKEQWNTHRIRKSRNDTVPGRPDSLFFLPDLHGAKDCLVDVPAAKIEFGTQHITDGTDNEHQEYFDYARISLSMPLPDNWQEALQLYKKLMHGYFS